ncbi:adenylyltransferase/cytidyltransferase family protein, partial [Bacillus xiapuensis]|nr:adenylyltransferase/cytidyltransferase family protein [Bacillus xiapuensis]
MKISFLNQIPDNRRLWDKKSSVMVLGFFDGIHLGHRKLIERAKQISLQKSLELSVLTFYPHPKEVLLHQDFDYLMSLDRKIESFRSLGVEHLYVVHFDQV